MLVDWLPSSPASEAVPVPGGVSLWALACLCVCVCVCLCVCVCVKAGRIPHGQRKKAYQLFSDQTVETFCWSGWMAVVNNFLHGHTHTHTHTHAYVPPTHTQIHADTRNNTLPPHRPTHNTLGDSTGITPWWFHLTIVSGLSRGVRVSGAIHCGVQMMRSSSDPEMGR